jgi:hypothetical protein
MRLMKIDMLKQYIALRRSLLTEKAALEARILEINRALSDNGSFGPVAGKATAPLAKAARRPRKRLKNPLSLKAAVAKVTTGKPLSKSEILEAVQKLGYRFTAKNPMNSLNTVLYSGNNFKNQNGKFSPR